MAKKIGEQGKAWDSVASSAMNKLPDNAQINRYDEYPGQVKTVQNLVLSASPLFGGVQFFIRGHYVFGAISIILGVIFLFLRQILSVDKAIIYQNGLLTAGVISQTEPLEVLVCASTATSSYIPKMYGVVKKKFKKLPNTQLSVGSKVPCICLFNFVNCQGYYTYIEPRPVVWGYPSLQDVEDATKAIRKDNDQSAILWSNYKALSKFMENVKEDTVCFFDENMSPVEMEKQETDLRSDQ